MLITASIYAGATHNLTIQGVIAAAIAGAIIGDNIGFTIGYKGGYSSAITANRRSNSSPPPSILRSESSPSS